MYKWLRNTHLLLGLFAFMFLLMYGMSSVQMAHNRWFDLRPAVSETTVTLAAGTDSPRAVARELMDRHGLRGDLNQVRQTATGATFRIARPGTVYEVQYTAANGEARVKTNTAGFMGMLNRIHHIGGLWHEYALINVWGALVGVVSASLVVIGITGVYLWFKIHTERVIGLVLLAVSLGYSVTLMVLIRTAR
jgi:hypothetical protein